MSGGELSGMYVVAATGVECDICRCGAWESDGGAPKYREAPLLSSAIALSREEWRKCAEYALSKADCAS